MKKVKRSLETISELTLRQAQQDAALLLEDIRNGIEPNADLHDQSSACWLVGDGYDEYGAGACASVF